VHHEPSEHLCSAKEFYVHPQQSKAVESTALDSFSAAMSSTAAFPSMAVATVRDGSGAAGCISTSRTLQRVCCCTVISLSVWLKPPGVATSGVLADQVADRGEATGEHGGIDPDHLLKGNEECE